MSSHEITHTFGPWSPMRFIPYSFRTESEPPAFWITTTRICMGLHDYRCTQAQTQTFGPLALESPAGAPAAIWTCPACKRPTPPVAGDDQEQVCLHCSEAATVQRSGDSRQDTAATASLAALHAASGMLRSVSPTDEPLAAALLEGTHEDLRSLLEDQAWGVKQDGSRARYTGTRLLTRIARQINANAREKITEQLPVRETGETAE